MTTEYDQGHNDGFKEGYDEGYKKGKEYFKKKVREAIEKKCLCTCINTKYLIFRCLRCSIIRDLNL